MYATATMSRVCVLFSLQRVYVANARQLTRLYAITRSPVFSHFRETIAGASNIRAYRVQESFIMENERRTDCHQSAYYPEVCTGRWLGIRLEFIGNLIILFAALFAVIQRDTSMSISAGLVGLSISHALKVKLSVSSYLPYKLFSMCRGEKINDSCLNLNS